MSNPASLFAGPALVVVDAKQKTYARYYGARHTMTVKGEETLSVAEVEAYRVDPHAFMGMEKSA